MDPAPQIPICVFAKPPRPGLSKTRLAAKIGSEAACRLATAFINDFLKQASGYEWGYPVIATIEEGMAEGSFPPAAFPAGDFQAESVPRWLQLAGDLGAKMEGIVRRGLDGGANAVIVCGADSPGRPVTRLSDAAEALQSGTVDAVLGPTEDGGFDILGLITCPEGLLAGLPWSQPITFEATKQRFEEHGMRVAVLDKWWDVDEVDDLDRLRKLLAGDGASRAPSTAAVLATIDGQAATEEK
eukprot:TRINITY_DN25286_c0_g1_i1.p1 TRINITY_DN25286_c0_g1~~TRINITY_DN25286_c0_g1_i1.p1  ORF type:complete len:261 (-),score=54.10 TRINITY_DN25286_c0_g1_i1:34-759(-)